MKRWHFLPCIALLALAVLSPLGAQGRKSSRSAAPTTLTRILGRPTDRSVTLSLLSPSSTEVLVEWGTRPDAPDRRTATLTLRGGVPSELELDGLAPDKAYGYRLTAKGSQPAFPAAEGAFHTQRVPGGSFTFALQGDSHPERPGKMYDSGLYARTLRNVAQDRPDFYLTLGDDFSIERLIEQGTLSQDRVDQVYAHQRNFLALTGAPLFLVNGNHEQAARYLLDGTATNPAVLASRARNRFFPLPAPEGFYTGDAEQVEPIGLLRDYYAWTWGDALFVVIDPYWHSPVAVDNPAGEGAKKGGKGKRDGWQITLGETQYRWLSRTLLESHARWKFVFAHHVNGTGRGGVEVSDLFEWGGKDSRGRDVFRQLRPGWPLPIHALFVKAGVTIFFQGHDHLYARQERDGVIYQEVPNPADPTYQTFNREAYRSGDLRPNSGHLRVTVAPERVRVDYVNAFLPGDEGPGRTNGQVAHTYLIGRP